MRREKLFGYGHCIPLDRNAKVRIITLARALTRRTEPGKHYGRLTGKFVTVLEALLWGFHNGPTGRCFPAYETIADRAGCCRATVYSAISALEAVGLLTWVNRLIRVRVHDELAVSWRWRVLRTSNAYALRDPAPSKSKFQTGTEGQIVKKEGNRQEVPLDPQNPLHRAILALERGARATETAAGALFRPPLGLDTP